jgi:isopentenyl-diphosphate delta-isomerase
VMYGYSNESPTLNPEEAIDYKWIGLDELKSAIVNQPELYTAWLKIILRDHHQHINSFSNYESLSERNI